jgi:hypothetical protein
MTNTHWKPCIEVWMNFYQTRTGQNYCFMPIDARCMKELLKKVSQKINERGLEISDDNLINSLNGFLHSITDKWMLEHLELKNVNSNFNTLYVKAVNNNPFTRSAGIDAAVNAKYGSNP